MLTCFEEVSKFAAVESRVFTGGCFFRVDFEGLCELLTESKCFERVGIVLNIDDNFSNEVFYFFHLIFPSMKKLF